MMVRSQITLKPELQRRARERASQLGISLAEYVRRLVARDLGQSRRKADPSLVIALGRSTGSNIARDKDRLIGEAVAAEHERELQTALAGRRQTVRPRSESRQQ